MDISLEHIMAVPLPDLSLTFGAIYMGTICAVLYVPQAVHACSRCLRACSLTGIAIVQAWNVRPGRLPVAAAD